MSQRIYRSPLPAVDIPHARFDEQVLRRSTDLPDKPAAMCAESGRVRTYAELERIVERVAVGLSASGIGVGDVIGLVSPNSIEFIETFLAASRIGAITSTVNPASTVGELTAQFTDSRAKLLVTTAAYADKCVETMRRVPSVRETIAVGGGDGCRHFETLYERGHAAPRATFDPATTVAALPYSSGTSGLPKGVMLTHRNLVANLAQIARSGIGFGEDDRLLAVLPLYHIYGMTVVMGGALAAGATLVIMPRFELETTLRVLERYRITYANVVPPIVLALAAHPSVDDYDLSALRMLKCGAAPLGAELAQRCEARIGCIVRQGYGLTEASPVTHLHPASSPHVDHASVGPPVAGTECRIVDPDTGIDSDTGERGELWVRGPQVMSGYLNRADATANAIDADGWLHTGDVAIVDERGWFRIVDRVKELIKYKGQQVAPAELEAVLLSCDAVADAAVIAAPDPDAGELPVAYVVPRDSATRARDVTTDDDKQRIMRFVAERVAPHKRIRGVEWIDAIPKSPSGKILRRLLVEQHRARMAGLR